ncbi:hypothetical protein [uncultured Fusobacterium sp.]|uniref:hypothetical protein n=1 Tax=uncultured Fusobacterium sp. TaxID=159267 RepID=UPI0025EB36D2|nr:hypothetical protein [uncultured Fusobacterium sp.]
MFFKYSEMELLMNVLKGIVDKKFIVNFYDDNDSSIKVEVISRFEDMEKLKDLFDEVKDTYYDHVCYYAYFENTLTFKWSFVV